MGIVIKDGLQYLDLGDGNLALVLDENGDPVPEVPESTKH